MNNRRYAVAFTLVELLTTLTVIGLLTTLLLPAVQSARAAAHRTCCVSKLRGLAIAVHGFHEANGHYPRHTFRVPRDVGPGGRAWSWTARVLPFTEESDRYDQLSVRKHKLGESLRHIAKPLDAARCPSDNSPSSIRTSGHFEGKEVGTTSYKAVCGANWGADVTQQLDDIGTLWRVKSATGSYDGQAHGDGIMWRDDHKKRMHAGKVRDGLSHTFLLGEDQAKHNHWNAWAYANNSFGTAAIPLNTNLHFPDAWSVSMGFRSGHTGGANFALADGSVQWISNDIALNVYRNYATRAAGGSKRRTR